MQEDEKFSEDVEVDLNRRNTATKTNDGSEDPYLQLGFGMVAYFSLLKMFIMVFIVLTLLAFPILFMY